MEDLHKFETGILDNVPDRAGLAGRQANKQASGQICRRTGRPEDRKTEKQTGGLTDRQAGRQAAGHIRKVRAAAIYCAGESKLSEAGENLGSGASPDSGAGGGRRAQSTEHRAQRIYGYMSI